MAGKVGAVSFALMVDGYNLLSAKPTAFSPRLTAVMEPTTGLGDTKTEQTPTGLMTVTLTQAGAFFDDTTNGMHALLSPAGAGAVSRILSAAYTGTTIGQPAISASGLYAQIYDVLNKVGGLTKADVTYAVSGPVERGPVLSFGAQTGDWTETSVDNGAATAAGAAGTLQVSALSGFTGFVGTIQDSPDNSAWTTRITFANVTAAPAAQRVSMAGAVARYVRFVGDVTGSGSITPLVTFGRG